MSLLGRIQIVKTFTIPKRMCRASLIALPIGLVKVVNSILYSFMWKGRDKVKRQALILDLKKWELEMLDIESMINAKRVAFLKISRGLCSHRGRYVNFLLSKNRSCALLNKSYKISIQIQLLI